jgi:hypothetical protein
MLCIIVPTLGNRIIEINNLFLSLENQTNRDFYVLCMVQENYNEIINTINKYDFDFEIIKLSKKGLSYSRNKAYKYIRKDTTYITFSDDDCWYPNNMVAKINKIIYNDKQCFCFRIFDPPKNKFYKKYNISPIEGLSKLQSLKVSSIEIFVPKSIVDKNITFDEKFGLGTLYPSGEENIFLFDLLKHKYIINYYPDIIVFHNVPIWTNKEYIFKGKGALFTRLYNKPIAIILVLIYSFKKFTYFTSFRKQCLQMFKEVFNYS